MKNKIHIFLLLVFLYTGTRAQIASQLKSKTTDSIFTPLGYEKSNITKVHKTIELANTQIKLGNFDSAQLFGNTALQLAREINYSKGIEKAYRTIGSCYTSKGDFSKAISNSFEALKLAEKNPDSIAMIIILKDIGNNYLLLNKIDMAKKYAYRAFSIAQNKHDKKYLLEPLLLLAGIEFFSKNYTQALTLYSQSLQLADSLKNDSDKSTILGNIAAVYGRRGNSQEAINYYNEALKINQKLGKQLLIATNLYGIATNKKALKEYDSAEIYLIEALSIYKNINSLPYMNHTYGELSDLYIETGNYKKALEYYKQAVIVKDSIFNIEKENEITKKELEYLYDKKYAENKKQLAISMERESKQRTVLFAVAGGLFLMLVFSVIIFRSLSTTKKQKSIIELQRNEVAEQKKIVDVKNKEITDSFHYAQRIQKALMASNHSLDKNLSDYFVLYLPKDIVSGDFYWAEETDGRFLLAVCDCTGHGVPGAFMSLLNITKLNETVREKKITAPSLVFNQVRDEIIKALNPEGNKEEGRDGMDAAFCSFDFANKKLHYSCANNPIIIIREGTIIETPVDKMPVGMYIEPQKDFTLHSFDLKTGDILYLFTDGYADQFGGPKGKKFKYSQLKQTLLNVCTMPMNEQQQVLQKVVESWKGDIEQVDDILIVGVKI